MNSCDPSKLVFDPIKYYANIILGAIIVASIIGVFVLLALNTC